MNFSDAHRFTNVDAGESPQEMVDYLDQVTRLALEGKRAGYARLELTPGMAVLDVGCGTGDDVRLLAELVGPAGRVVGIDFSRTMIDEALKRGLPPNVEVLCASAETLPLENGRFDAVRSERVFQHLEHPEAAARELFRILRPAGRAMVIDQDWNTLVIAGAEPALTRTIVHAFVHHLANGSAGSNHVPMLKRSGFCDVVSEPFVYQLPFAPSYALMLKTAVDHALATGAITAAQAQGWVADLQSADERGEFFCAFTIFSAIGRKP